MSVTKTPSGDRPLWKRWTVIGGMILAAVKFCEAEDLIPVGTGESVASLIETAGSLLVGLGIYRHIPTT